MYGRPGKDFFDENGVVHEQPVYECPEDNLPPTWEQHGGSTRVNDDNANGSNR